MCDQPRHSDGCGPWKSEQHGFCTGLNSISSTRERFRIEDVELPLSVLPDLRGFIAVRLPAMRLKVRLLFLLVSVSHGDVMDHWYQLRFSTLGLVQHVFKPGGAIWNFHHVPVG